MSERPPAREDVPARRRRSPGLRLQIVLALAGIILVAYVPLFFAIAQVTRATSLSYREDAARSLGRSVAAHVADVAAQPSEDSLAKTKLLRRTMASHVGSRGALSIALFDAQGHLVLRQPDTNDGFAPPPLPYRDAVERAMVPEGRALDVVLPTTTGEAVVVRVVADDDPEQSGQLVRGIALYMSVFALGILVFAYIVLTRAIVRPIEELARAADRVAGGARDLELPSAGAREVAELGSSVRAMAARLLREEQALRGKIEELTSTTKRLGETREQLAGSEHMASVGKLAAGVAHEIGNPIAAIMGMHDLLDDGEMTDGDRSDFLRRMRKETERIHVNVRDLIDYARPESGIGSGNLVGKILVAPIGEVVDDAMALVRPQKDFKNVDTKLEIANGLTVALGPQRLTQVLLNLLLNAGAAMAERPGMHALTVRAFRKRDDHAARVVRIEIEDDGPGVPPDLAPRIFDPFVTTKDVGSGTGLGLAVCRGIVDGAGGRIFVDLDCTTGARFVIELPAPPVESDVPGA